MRYLLSFSLCFFTIFAMDNTDVWPKPVEFSYGDQIVYLPATQFSFTTYDASKDNAPVEVDTLTKAYSRYNDIIYDGHYHTQQTSSSLPHFSASVDVFVDDLDESYPQLDTNESYSVNIPSEDNGSESKTR